MTRASRARHVSLDLSSTSSEPGSHWIPLHDLGSQTDRAMAPDRGDSHRVSDEHAHDSDHEPILAETVGREPDAEFLAQRSEEKQFTLRALLCGLVIGVLITFSNTYFGLQTGWVSGMTMPSALIGFAYFKGLRTLMSKAGPLARFGFGEGFSEVENVLVQSVAGSVGTMPLGCGFVGVVPALEFLLKPSETPESSSTDPDIISTLLSAAKEGGLRLPLGKLILWALGLCFFGVVFAVPLRKQVIIREKLKFPSGTATALMIGVLHGGDKTGAEGNMESHARKRRRPEGSDEESRGLLGSNNQANELAPAVEDEDESSQKHDALKRDWKKQIRLLTTSFGVSGAYTLISYFVPQLHSLPILGTYLSNKWLWNLNPSPAYVGQGIIMGPATTIHMLIGAVIGWAVLSPVAKNNGWAPGDVSDWNTGSKGWIVWTSLAIMLADAIVSLGWLILRPTIFYSRLYLPEAWNSVRDKGVSGSLQQFFRTKKRGYNSLGNDEDQLALAKSRSNMMDDEPEYDAPPEHQIGFKTTIIGLIISVAFCIGVVQYSFGGIINIKLTILAMVLAILLSIMAIRALGETDLNPVSGISKLTQLVFALVTPPGSKNAVTINLIAGAISEAGALQAGDLLQDIKTGHLLGASPAAQFYGQLIGSAVGAVLSASVYRLYTSVYKIPGGLFQVPTGFVWIFTARLVTGQGLPPHVPEYAIGATIIWSLLTALRIYGQSVKQVDGSKGAWWVPYIPGGIAVAVGMYNTPSFTLARTAGGLMSWYWTVWRKKAETPVIIIASGLILGEGLVSIVNLGLASAQVPHL